ncbi:MAG: endonuclease NucS [Anaerolineales bacterium]
MASEIKSWQIVDGKLVSLESSLINDGKKERDDLEQWIKSNPQILGEDIVIIGEQVQTTSGPLDFLGIDNSGNTVIVELKRDKLPREALAQAIDYASDVANWDVDRFREICQKYTNQNLEDLLQERFEDISIEELAINQSQRLLLVGTAVEESLGRMIEWLSDNYNLGINAVVLNYAKTKNGDAILSRMVIIPEEIEKQKVNKKKFIIEMSNEPGTYDLKTLEIKLTEYLSKSLWSSQRLRDYFLPTLLAKGQVTREQLRKEFVRLKAAEDESQAGYFLSLISSQLGHKLKDYLRQVIYYEYPNHPWEKDNFRIKDEYIDLVEKVLSKLKKNS